MTSATYRRMPRYIFDVVEEQVPKRVLEKVNISLRTDAFNLRSQLRVTVPDGRVFDFNLDDSGRLSQDDVAFLCVLT